jgi:hypothetical protein
LWRKQLPEPANRLGHHDDDHYNHNYYHHHDNHDDNYAGTASVAWNLRWRPGSKPLRRG